MTHNERPNKRCILYCVAWSPYENATGWEYHSLCFNTRKKRNDYIRRISHRAKYIKTEEIVRYA